MKEDFSYLDSSLQKCPLCELTNFEFLHGNDRFDMGVITVGCKTCGLIQSNPRPSQSGLDVFYSRDYRRFYQNIVNPSEEYILSTNKNIRMNYAVKYLDDIINLNNLNSILDFGCSEGSFFESLINYGYNGQLLGVEPNKNFVEFINSSRNIHIFSNINEVNKSFDLVVFIHVFEHLLNPNFILSKLLVNLNKGGLIYIDVPDADEYENLSSLHIAHVYHFTLNTLKAMVEKAGFTVLVCEKHLPPFHPKSIRLLARFDNEHNLNWKVPESHNEFNVWAKIRRIKTFIFLLKFKLTRNSFFMKLYKLVFS